MKITLMYNGTQLGRYTATQVPGVGDWITLEDSSTYTVDIVNWTPDSTEHDAVLKLG